MAGTRSYVSGNFMFNLDGVKCGFIKSVEGGDATAEVVEEKSGPDKFTKKHLGPLKYEDLTLSIGFAMEQNVYDWIAASWQRELRAQGRLDRHRGREPPGAQRASVLPRTHQRGDDSRARRSLEGAGLPVREPLPGIHPRRARRAGR